MSDIKPVFKCEDHFRNIFRSSQCLLTISVGQEVHEGDKFKKTIDLVNATFQSCVVLIDDTLQRHTMAIETDYISGESMIDISREEGILWLERNKSVLFEYLTIPHKIIYWDKWLLHPQFKQINNQLHDLYLSDHLFKKAIDETIDEFLVRYDRRHAMRCFFSDARVRSLCYSYLIEECTAMCLWPELGCQFEVYPSHRNMAMKETHQRFVLPEHPTLLYPVRVKFKNKKQLKPQKFQWRAEEELAFSA